MEIKSKDKSSFDAVYDEIADEVYRVALYYSKDHHAAEDITQTVFMKWYIDYENVSKERILAWAKVTAKNLALNYKRDKKHEVDIEMEDIEDIIDAREHEESIEEFLEYRNKNQLRIELIKEIYDGEYELYSGGYTSRGDNECSTEWET